MSLKSIITGRGDPQPAHPDQERLLRSLKKFRQQHGSQSPVEAARQGLISKFKASELATALVLEGEIQRGDRQVR